MDGRSGSRFEEFRATRNLSRIDDCVNRWIWRRRGCGCVGTVDHTTGVETAGCVVESQVQKEAFNTGPTSFANENVDGSACAVHCGDASGAKAVRRIEQGVDAREADDVFDKVVEMLVCERTTVAPYERRAVVWARRPGCEVCLEENERTEGATARVAAVFGSAAHLICLGLCDVEADTVVVSDEPFSCENCISRYRAVFGDAQEEDIADAEGEGDDGVVGDG